MEQVLARWLHRPEPTMPDIDSDDPDPLDDDLPDAPVRATQADMLEVRDIETALKRLPVEQREVLLLVALEHLSYQETANALGIPIGTVMSRLARARERLRMMLAGEAGTASLKVVK